MTNEVETSKTDQRPRKFNNNKKKHMQKHGKLELKGTETGQNEVFEPPKFYQWEVDQEN